ncbi:MAG TPA: site-specific DNA-methyltransferase [Candidatus Saccharimonadales bacterium]|nr:site-specific DNA-methyltransferase [Candidatus Saccharimonadales bacterium]
MSKKLDEYTKEELISYIRQLQKDTKFGLVWNPKEEQVAIDCRTRVPVLREVSQKTIAKADEGDPTHLLLEGDNYHSLSVLNYTHAGRINVIYIDPPYNTGNKDFIYNDHYVDKEDPYRHSEWLSFMDNRLRLAKNLLASTGTIFISIDDNEYAHLKILCDKIFGEENFITSIIWQRKRGRDNSAKYFSKSHEYLLVYSRIKNAPTLNKINMDEGTKKAYRNPDNDPRGAYRLLGAWARGTQGGSRYEFISKNGKIFSERLWLFAKSRMLELDRDDRLVFVGDKVYRKLFLSEHTGSVPETVWADTSNAANAADEIKTIFGKQVFDTVKPLPFIKRILQIATDKNGIILDFFAGSGTTGHAVLQLNAQDGGKRQFILGTNNENGIAENITYERIDRVINGYSGTQGIPAKLRYYKTDFVNTNNLDSLTDKDRLEIAKEMAVMVALHENSFDQVEQTDYWQTYENNIQVTAIYYREDKTRIQEYIDKLNTQDKHVKLYIFGWGKNVGREYASKKISVEDIPEPLIELYREITK